MGGIFISYRREDTGPYAGRLRDKLSGHFGETQVFRDLDRISPGERFPQSIERALSSSDALVALIGPNWPSVSADGKRRIDDPRDYVRMEIAAALARQDVLVIPVLIGSTAMPMPDALPEPLVGLAECNALRVTDDGWDDQVSRLVKALEKVVVRAKPAPEPQPLPGPRPPRPQWAPSPDLQPYRPPVPPRKRRGGSLAWLTACLAVLVVMGGLAYAALTIFADFFQDFGPGSSTIVLSPTSGPPGTVISVTGTGYGKEETVEINFHATEIGTVLTGPDGSFTAKVTIPATPFRGQQFDIRAVGKRTIRSDSAPFQVR